MKRERERGREGEALPIFFSASSTTASSYFVNATRVQTDMLLRVALTLALVSLGRESTFFA